MAVDFVEKKKKQKYLLFIVLGLLAITAVILWFGYFNQEPEQPEEVYIVKKNVKINYEILDNPILKELVSFQKTPDYDGVLGKSNPFLK